MDKLTLDAMGERYPLLAPVLEITFSKEGINALSLLWRLKERGLVRIENELLVMAILADNNWDGDRNRVIKASFPLGAIWHDEIFRERIARDIEMIRLTTPRALNVLMTGRKKVQDENAARIIQDCYGDLEDELGEFGLTISGELTIVSGLPKLIFQLKSDAETVVAVIELDGWSGQIVINGSPQQKAYSQPEEFHEIVRNLALEYMDKMTSPA